MTVPDDPYPNATEDLLRKMDPRDPVRKAIEKVREDRKRELAAAAEAAFNADVERHRNRLENLVALFFSTRCQHPEQFGEGGSAHSFREACAMAALADAFEVIKTVDGAALSLANLDRANRGQKEETK